MKIKNIVYIGLGSNKGDRENYLLSAIEKIDSDTGCDVDIVSSVYETKPFGVKDQADFLNAVIRIYTIYSPGDLFIFLKSIESNLGRVETLKWGPREIDLDILFYNDLVYTDENITIPHNGVMERDFVLLPLCEIEPGLIHPVTGNKLYDSILPDALKNVKNKFTLNVFSK